MNALMKSQPVVPSKYITVPLSAIADSPTNPRKSFDAKYLTELAGSIARHGMLHAPIVVPLRAAGVVVPGKYVMVAGHCRKLAVTELGWKEIEVKLVDAGEVEQLEKQLVENDERKDLTALERGEGYQLLQKKFGLSVDAIAERVSKSKAAVYASMKLCDLLEEGKKFVLAGKLSASCAELIARLDISVQPEVLEKAAYKGWGDAWCEMSFRELKELIAEQYMFDLSKAPFDTEDAALVPAAGACTTCPYRTGRQSDMFGGTKISADICTKPPCHTKKVAAHKAAVVEKAKASGKDVLDAAEAKKALSGNYNSGYVKLSDTHYDGGKDKSWADELKGTKLEPQIAIDEHGKQIKVAKKEDVRAALKEAGKKAAKSHELAPPTKYSQPKPESPEAQAKRVAEEALNAKVASTAIARVVAHIEAKGLTGKLLRLVVMRVVTSGSAFGAYERRGLKTSDHYPSEKDFTKHFEAAKDNKLLGLLFEICDEEVGDFRNGEASETLAEACAIVGLDLTKIEAELTPKAAPAKPSMGEQIKELAAQVGKRAAKAKKPAKKKAGKK